MRLLGAITATVMLAGCTFGAPGSAGVAGGSSATTIDINLTSHPPTAIDAGVAGGYAPATITVAVGTHIRFVNSDSFAHTASAVSGATFPAASPLDGSALSARPGSLAAGWTTGNLTAGTASQEFIADRPGVYLYGCFYHYAAPMRGAIVVR
ncbi:MAG: hypothetical protein NVSMB64_05790 [Candidatus Velthaea sp.]